ncbi:MAG TPA: hypothetical protein VFJ16_31050 [Longimicrobium sp.]|nr:hypothetical protein [Longimicrobium sp.]
MTGHRIGAALAALLAAAPAAAQGGDGPRDRWRLPAPPTLEVAARGHYAAPAITVGIPSGFGADWADGFVGAGFQHRTRWRDRPDAGLVAGFGVGSARRNVGLEVAVSQFGTIHSCCRGGVSVKAHRLIVPAGASIAVGVENGATWGHAEGSAHATDAGTSVYLVGSKVIRLRRDPAYPLGSLSVTAGVGSGRFRTEDQVFARTRTVNPFGGLSLRLARPASLLATWTGQDATAAVSVLPLGRVPLLVTPGVADLTTRPRFILGVGYGFTLGGSI